MSAELERRVNRARRQIGAGIPSRSGGQVGFVHDNNIVRFTRDGLGLHLFPVQASLLKVIACSAFATTSMPVAVPW